ncbi:MAG TPA: amidase [Stellaceae bacterium]|jgi:aspartyl-tRNA(Asn)/glutamyl-tRNA(Gln) amidotransferase subunit A|nr:amidase [Stellaceae bacterium]
MPPANTDPALLPAHVLAAEIDADRLSPVDVVDALLARIRGSDQKLRAYVEVYADEARLAAEAADKAIRSGHRIGPLHGIPIALKDLIEIEGRVTTGGSQVWHDRRSTYTATIAKRMIAAGMIVLGKTHTVEFAMGGWGTNQHRGTPWNPWDPAVARTPGGSSSGTGVAVAACLAPWGIGTDTGGSVRLPASWCGLSGLKTTIGRVSTYGILPLSPSLDTPGPMARSVEDAALLYQAIEGPDPDDPRTLGRPSAGPLPTMRRGVRGLKLARMPAVERDHVEAQVLNAYDSAIDTLARLGAEIVTVDLPRRFADYTQLTGRIIGAESYFLVGDLIDDISLPIDEAVRPRIASGRGVSARDYLAALREQAAAKREFAAALGDADALLTPTTTTAAIPLDAVDQSTTPAHFTRFVNALEICALAVPSGFTVNGLPLSLQIVCRAFDEETALRIGWAYQQATDWHDRRPPGVAG